jgi:hypothetical protein
VSRSVGTVPRARVPSIWPLALLVVFVVVGWLVWPPRDMPIAEVPGVHSGGADSASHSRGADAPAGGTARTMATPEPAPFVPTGAPAQGDHPSWALHVASHEGAPAAGLVCEFRTPGSQVLFRGETDHAGRIDLPSNLTGSDDRFLRFYVGAVCWVEFRGVVFENPTHLSLPPLQRCSVTIDVPAYLRAEEREYKLFCTRCDRSGGKLAEPVVTKSAGESVTSVLLSPWPLVVRDGTTDFLAPANTQLLIEATSNHARLTPPSHVASAPCSLRFLFDGRVPCTLLQVEDALGSELVDGEVFFVIGQWSTTRLPLTAGRAVITKELWSHLSSQEAVAPLVTIVSSTGGFFSAPLHSIRRTISADSPPDTILHVDASSLSGGLRIDTTFDDPATSTYGHRADGSVFPIDREVSLREPERAFRCQIGREVAFHRLPSTWSRLVLVWSDGRVTTIERAGDQGGRQHRMPAERTLDLDFARDVAPLVEAHGAVLVSFRLYVDGKAQIHPLQLDLIIVETPADCRGLHWSKTVVSGARAEIVAQTAAGPRILRN